MELKKSDIKHLSWIWERMVNVHGEKSNVDYMLALNGIILKLKNDYAFHDDEDDADIAVALEQPKQEVEWKNGDECYYTGELGDKLTFVSIHPNNDKCAIVWSGGGDCNLSCVAIDCLAKQKSERELVIEQAKPIIEDLMRDEWSVNCLIDGLYDAGMLKPIKE